MQHIRLLKRVGFAQAIHDALHNRDKPHNATCDAERGDAANNADGKHDKSGLVIAQIELVNAEYPQEKRIQGGCVLRFTGSKGGRIEAIIHDHGSNLPARCGGGAAGVGANGWERVARSVCAGSGAGSGAAGVGARGIGAASGAADVAVAGVWAGGARSRRMRR